MAASAVEPRETVMSELKLAAAPPVVPAPPVPAGQGRSRFRELWPERLVETTSQLAARIQERFPGSGLQNVALELRQIAQEALVRSELIRRPN